MSEQKLNKSLLRKVRNRIAKIPESYYQHDFCIDSDDAPCGTAACLAGEAIIVSKPTVAEGIKSLRRSMSYLRHSDREYDWVADSPIAKRAAKLLGISYDEAGEMFSDLPDWPEPFREQFRDASDAADRRAQAAVAVAYLDECLKRGKVTW